MKTREQWLNDFSKRYAKEFAKHGHPLPPHRISCGWPSKGAMSKKRRSVGECWDKKASAHNVYEIFISPFLQEPIDVASTLLHELIHAAVGNECGHKGAFKRLALALGLEGPMRSTEPGKLLEERLNTLCKKIGDYPHASIDKTTAKKQGTRMIKLECVGCGYVVRTTQKWIEVGIPNCCCGEYFTVVIAGEEK